VKPDVFRRKTFASFTKLLDNYNQETGAMEHESEEEKREINNFLNLIMDTAPIQYVHQYLIQKGKADPSISEFRELLYNLWFDFYRRDTFDDSCGFEHVFVGESRTGGGVLGFHNWIQYYLQEKKKTVDYLGHIPAKRRGRQDPTPNMLTIKFHWDDDDGRADKVTKSVGSLFLGTSPEFEFALYTLCFLVGGENNRVKVGDYLVEIECHPIRGRGKTWI